MCVRERERGGEKRDLEGKHKCFLCCHLCSISKAGHRGVCQAERELSVAVNITYRHNI